MDTLQLPPIENAYYNHEQNYTLHPDLIFVFGSNLAGRHGAGAAATAMKRYGAIYGQGIGFQGKSYGLPTKDRNIITLPLRSIEFYAKQFIHVSRQSDLKFYLTPVGTGRAGYKHGDIAPLFRGCQNCWVPEAWKPFLEN